MKSREDHERISDLFLKVCDLDPAKRRELLDRECADDPKLRQEVESLLAYDGLADQALQTGIGAARAAAVLEQGARPSGEAETTSDGVTPFPGFKLLRLLGEGGMGKVFLAEELALGRQVAIKVISQRALLHDVAASRFIREARAMAKVEHPHVVRVYSFGEIDGRYYLVMEFVEGESLADRLRRTGRIRSHEALRIVHQTIEALTAAWQYGIVHRDIKPANVLIDTHGHVRVADFGLAKAITSEEDTAITDGSHVLGTPYYISPEQALGRPDLDFRTDVYSLGIVLYEMITGEPPFCGDTPVTIIDQHLHTPLPAFRTTCLEVSGEIEQLCEWMTRKQPDDRPASYSELGRVVAALLGKSVVEPTDAPQPLFLGTSGDERAWPIFVGRERELQKLGQVLDRAVAGRGGVALVAGEAGCGKTALVSEFLRRAHDRFPDLVVAVGHCNAQTGSGDPYLPFRELLSLLTGDVESKRISGVIQGDHARRLWRLVPLACEALVSQGPDLLETFVTGQELVSRASAFTPSPAGWRVRLGELVERRLRLPRDVGLQQADLFDQYGKMLLSLSRRHPLLLEIEDLHWADGGSCGLLFHLARRIVSSRILVIGTFRPSEIVLEESRRHPLEGIVEELKRQYGEMEIQLGEEETRDFTNKLLDAIPNRFSVTFRDRFYDRTRGHPLFSVELLREMQQHGMLSIAAEGLWRESSTLDWKTIPARVEGAIGQRLGRIPSDQRKVLSLACVQGEEFVAEVLARIQGLPEPEMIRMLSEQLDKRYHLIRAQGTYRANGQRISTYRFRHTLFQAFLYGELDEVERVYLHEQTGNVLEAIYGESAEEAAVRLARHFRLAGVLPKAIDYLRAAGERAARLAADAEAIAHLRNALDLLSRLRPGPETRRQELALQLALGPPLMDTVGPGSDELSRAYGRARELCDESGEAPQLFQTLFLLVHHHANKGELPAALELARKLVEIAEDSKDPVLVIMSLWARGFANHYMGNLSEALHDHDRVVELYDPVRHSALAYAFGMDPAVSALCYNGTSSWCLGRIGQAHEYGERSLRLAKELDHPSSLAHALTQAAVLAFFLRDAELLQKRVEALFEVSTRRGILLFRAWAIIGQGMVLAQQGEDEAAVARIREGIAATDAAGSRLSRPIAMGVLAELRARSGDLDEALQLTTTAIASAAESGDRQFEPELHRIHGELLLGQRGSDASAIAEASFRRAIELARVQGAASWVLRSTISLSRLLRDIGRVADARQRLRDIYDQFEEEVETRDLQQARDLLEQLPR